ncbi:MAG: FMN-binding protein [Spirochaetales bacterium]|nr:MAG: FMN-binding protein [Spirochaetales bacterium]
MKDKILMIIFVIITGSILTTALVVVDGYTKPIIAKNAAIKLKSSIMSALNIDFTEQNVEEIFAKSVKEESKGGKSFYAAMDGVVALPFKGAGLWGPITGVLAMSGDLKTIKGLTIIHQEETPGLGSRIAEKAHLDKFLNKEFAPALETVSEGKTEKNTQIDAISGATMSSKALVNILNAQYEEYRAVF